MHRLTKGMAALVGLVFLATGGQGQTIQGELTATENKKTHHVKLEAGKVYQVDLVSKAFDPFLWLQGPTGKDLISDDDGGDGLNSRLVFAPKATADYKLLAGSFSNNGKGAYTLVVLALPEATVSKAITVKIDKTSSIYKDVAFKSYAVSLIAGKSYKIDLTGDNAVIDPIFGIRKAGEAKFEASDDNGGGGKNARLMFTPKTTGLYELSCGSQGAKEGEMNLHIQETSKKEPFSGLVHAIADRTGKSREHGHAISVPPSPPCQGQQFRDNSLKRTSLFFRGNRS